MSPQQVLPKPFAECYECEEKCTYIWPMSRIIEEIQRLSTQKVTVENKLLPLATEIILLERQGKLLEELVEIEEKLNSLRKRK